MRIGLLDHHIEIYRYVDKTSDSGMRTKVRTKVCTLRAHLVSKEATFKENENEQYDSVTIVLETWRNADVKDSDTLCFCGQEFKIVLIDYSDRDLVMKIKAKKIIK